MTSKRHSDEERSLHMNHIWSIDFACNRLGIGHMKMERLPDPKEDLAIELMRTIKMGFHPNGILNPRRLPCPDTQA